MANWIKYNVNPINNRVGDCVVRAISKALKQDWEKTYTELCVEGFLMCDMPSANSVWHVYLTRKGFKRGIVDMPCESCYTVNDFCNDHPKGTYILGTGSHVIAVEDGFFFDTWNSGDEIPIYYWQKEQ